MRDYWHDIRPTVRRVVNFAAGGVVMAFLLIPAVNAAGGYGMTRGEMWAAWNLCAAFAFVIGLVIEGLRNAYRHACWAIDDACARWQERRDNEAEAA